MQDNVNPYQAPRESVERLQISAIHVAAFSFPAEHADCRYFTFREFADLFEAKLHDACAPFGIPTIRVGEEDRIDDRTSTISGAIVALTDYQLTPWNRFRKWVLPFLGYNYRPASFEIVGQIESLQHPTIPFRLKRNFKRGRLGEKRNLTIGLDSEAARVISLAVGKRSGMTSETASRPFWLTLFGVPICAAIVCTVLAYTFPEARADTRWIRAVLSFAATALITVSALPGWLYRDPRAGFFYRVTAAKRSWELRLFPLIVGLIAAGLLIASIIHGDG
ncbi:MAG: hypothetical protein KDB00_01750 [Planctomycetales bacterium]|nr:hypothetical protein [Planctomycetales bacterium]